MLILLSYSDGRLMIKWIAYIFLFSAVPVLTGMGSLQGPSSTDSIPLPVKKFDAVFVDQMNVITECSEVSIEGATFLEGKRGDGNYTISFDNIDLISYRMHAQQLTAVVKLRDGTVSELTLKKTQKAFGRTKYGTFQISLSDLKKMIIRSAMATR